MFGLRAFFKEDNDLFTNRFGAYEKRAQGLIVLGIRGQVYRLSIDINAELMVRVRPRVCLLKSFIIVELLRYALDGA